MLLHYKMNCWVEFDSITIPAVAHCIRIRGARSQEAHMYDRGAPKVGQVNILGHERMYRVTHV